VREQLAVADRYRRLEQPRRVEVRHDGHRLRGRLSAWRKDKGDTRWLGYVTFSHLDGVTQPKWFDQDDIRLLPLPEPRFRGRGCPHVS
jgi:hypothetical protein